MFKVDKYSVCIEPNGYNKKAKKQFEKPKGLFKSFPQVIVNKHNLHKRIILCESRGLFVYTSPVRMLGIMTPKEIKESYVLLNDNERLQKYLEGFKEIVDNYCDKEI